MISPYVVRAIGARTANWLFMTAEKMDARTALNCHLVHQIIPEEELPAYAHQYARNIARLAQDAKQLVQTVSGQPIDASLQDLTAALIAKKRASAEGIKGMQAFLNKETPLWD